MTVATDFSIKQGDRAPYLRRILEDATGNALDLSGLTVKFYMRNAYTGITVVNAASVVIIDALTGVVEYRWDSDDTAFTGHYLGEFKVTIGSGILETFPNDTYIHIRVFQGLS